MYTILKKTITCFNIHTNPWHTALGMFCGVLLLTLSSYVAIPMIPVPLCLQSMTVMMIGVSYGWRLGGSTLMLWMVAGLCGFPVFANGQSGLTYFLGFTGGYLVSFPIIAVLVGQLYDKGWQGKWTFVSFLIGHALCLLLGWSWLVSFVGMSKAFQLGVYPFIIGDILKSCVAASLFHFKQKQQ